MENRESRERKVWNMRSVEKECVDNEESGT